MNQRILKVNAEIQKYVSEIIFDLKNPDISGLITVSRVDTTQDLDSCKVFVSIYNADNKEDSFNAILHSAGYIRKELSNKLNLRKTPFLQFILDNGNDYSSSINEKLKTIENERKVNTNEDTK